MTRRFLRSRRLPRPGPELRDMARIAAPIVLINVGIQAMGVVDALMVGRLGGFAIGAVALGNFYFFNASVFGVGLLFALDPVIGQAVGAGDTDGIARGVQRGLVLAAVLAVLVSLVLWPAAPVLRALGQPDDVVPATAAYLHRRLLGALPFFAFNVWRQTLQAMGPVRPILVAVVVGNVVNAAANALLIEGRFGVPALGVSGAGWATAIAQWVMALTLVGAGWRLLAPTLRPWRDDVLRRRPFARLVTLGVPMGVQFFFESFAFGLTTLMMGWFGTASLAGHEIALNMASLTFMVPLGVSSAAAVVVGRAVGRGDAPAARRDAAAAIACGVGFMALSAAAFVLAPDWLARRYTDEAATLAVAVSLVPIAGFFQLFDGAQAVTSGVLRGIGDTRVPALLHLLAFWGVGVPLGTLLAFTTPLRERGLWWGLTAGLAAAAALQTWRVRVRMRGDLRRFVVDGEPGDDAPGAAGGLPATPAA